MKRFVALVLSTFVLFAAGLVSFAAPVHSNSPAQWHATAVLTNTDTGEKSFVPINLAESSIKKTSDSSQCFTEKATVYFKISNGEIQPCYSDTSISETDVKATIKITYNRSSDKIQVTNVSGSWIPDNSQIQKSNRSVDYGDGGPLSSGHSAHQKPTSNSFSYTTGWPWVTWYPASSDAMSGARAYSTATVSVTGMSSHTIEVFVTATK